MSNENELLAAVARARDFTKHPNIHFHYKDGAEVMSALADAVEASIARRPILSDEAVERARAGMTTYLRDRSIYDAGIMQYHGNHLAREALTAAFSPPPEPAPSSPVPVEVVGWQLVPIDPTEAQWGGLARALVMWWGMGDRPTGKLLYSHLTRTGEDIPDWLRSEIPDIDHVPPKGTVAACIYRAMLSAAPAHREVGE